jgi:predicted PhzF superfamily epimerase YddE/YHI9
VDFPLVQLDAFVESRLESNSVAVMPLAAWLDDAVLQRVASQGSNLSETAFVVDSLPAEAPTDLTRVSRRTPAVVHTGRSKWTSAFAQQLP